MFNIKTGGECGKHRSLYADMLTKITGMCKWWFTSYGMLCHLDWNFSTFRRIVLPSSKVLRSWRRLESSVTPLWEHQNLFIWRHYCSM